MALKNPVLPLNEYITYLKKQQANLKAEISRLSTPDEIKRKTAEAVVATKAKRILAFKEVLDTITEQSYYTGQLEMVNDLLAVAEQSLKQFQEVNNDRQTVDVRN